LHLLVEQFKLSPEKVAIELNRRLARSDKYEGEKNRTAIHVLLHRICG